LSLAGVPPLTGFIPKLIVIIAIVESNFFILLILLAGSYINLYYYLIIAIASIICSNNNLKWTSPYLKILPLSIVIASSLIGMIIIF
jgi:NADH:ubiquinone oxidoreductase subunit 2 (subunit N)